MSEPKPYVITTSHRGVFFGYSTDTPETIVKNERVSLTKARMCVYWSSDMGGVLGLAARGPSPSCRIGPPASLALTAVTSVMSVENPEAVTRWNEAQWK